MTEKEYKLFYSYGVNNGKWLLLHKEKINLVVSENDYRFISSTLDSMTPLHNYIHLFYLDTNNSNCEYQYKDNEYTSIEEECDTTDQLIQERESTHGGFDNNAVLTMACIEGYQKTSIYQEHTPKQRLANIMMLHKLSRDICSNGASADHMEDLQGYRKLRG